MSQHHTEHVNVAANLTFGVIPSICMILILGAISAYFFGQYQNSARLANAQSTAIDAAIIEGRAYHHKQGRLLRKIAIHVGMPPTEVEEILPEASLKCDTPNTPDNIIRAAWLSF